MTMSASIISCEQFDTIQARRRALNDDFNNHAKINGLVSVIYYPGAAGCCAYPTGHSELEVEGSCYTFIGNMQTEEEPLHGKIQKAKRGRLPFWQSHIYITPRQLSNIKNTLASSQPLDSEGINMQRGSSGEKRLDAQLANVRTNPQICGATCMHGVSDILDRSANIHIPALINVSPLASYLYLRTAKILGSDRITKIESYGSSFASIRNFAIVSCGVMSELVMWGFAIAGAIALASFSSQP